MFCIRFATPEIFALLDIARKIFNNHLVDMQDLLSQLAVGSVSSV